MSRMYVHFSKLDKNAVLYNYNCMVFKSFLSISPKSLKIFIEEIYKNHKSTNNCYNNLCV